MDLSTLLRISQAQIQIIRYEEPFILLLGNLGNIANILIFGRRELRKNVCSRYFICLSLAHLLLLDTLCFSRILTTSTGNNVFQYIMSLCKLRTYFTEFSTLLSRYFLCLISIDRWMVTSSSARLRQQSSTRASRWLIIIGILFWAIFSSHAAIGFQTGPVECTPPAGSIYSMFYSIEAIIVAMVPMFIMIVFSCLTVFNVRSRVIRQIQPTQVILSIHTETQQTNMSNASRQLFKYNIQLVRLSILQVIFYFLLNTTWSINALYQLLIGVQGMMNINQQLTIVFLGRLGLNLLFTYTAVCCFRSIFKVFYYLFLDHIHTVYVSVSSISKRMCYYLTTMVNNYPSTFLII